MSHQADAQPWFAPSLLDPGVEQSGNPREFERLWRGFMTARVTLGLVLLLLQSTVFGLGVSKNTTLVLICAGYFVAALTVRLAARPRQLEHVFDAQWISTIGADILTFAALQVFQGGNVNYAPLFALPVLMASVLGSLLLALGTAAGVTLLLFGYATWMSLEIPGSASSNYLQAALTGAGCFVISFLANQIANRLASEELRAERSQLAARVQSLVNELVIESLTDGVLVVDTHGSVRAANPAARQLLGAELAVRVSSFSLSSLVGWQGLVDLMRQSFATHAPQQAEVTIHHAGQGPRRVRVRTQLTPTQDSAQSLCVMFMQDQREMEAKMRTDKLASMGRMSAAVAHEIRNPLAAISQANALLEEDLSEPRHKQLTQMVQQNAKRLERIVEDVLNISRVQHSDSSLAAITLDLNESVERICQDWQQQHKSKGQVLTVELLPSAMEVRFETEHLRRILINLLDNAIRYASHRPGAMQVSTTVSPSGQASVSVWSDGHPLEQSVERHLFEPFFSSESRSSGLGLYLCRELCEGHGASITYFRTQRVINAQSVPGNEFIVTFQTRQVPQDKHGHPMRM